MKTSEKRTTSLQGTTGLSPMCPLFRGFTVHAQYIYALVKEHLLANPLPVGEMTTDEQFHQVVFSF